MQPAVAHCQRVADLAFVADRLVVVVGAVDHHVAGTIAAAFIREAARHDQRVFAARMGVARDLGAGRNPVEFRFELGARVEVQAFQPPPHRLPAGLADRVQRRRAQRLGQCQHLFHRLARGAARAHGGDLVSVQRVDGGQRPVERALGQPGGGRRLQDAAGDHFAERHRIADFRAQHALRFHHQRERRIETARRIGSVKLTERVGRRSRHRLKIPVVSRNIVLLTRRSRRQGCGLQQKG